MHTIETMAIYEDGVLRPSAPLALTEHAIVRVSVQVPTSEDTEHRRRVDDALVQAGLSLPTADTEPLPAPLTEERREELERLFSAGRPLSELIVEEREAS
jgi:predicted DNA-binding antitoxin AbrB/MazE fold protein